MAAPRPVPLVRVVEASAVGEPPVRLVVSGLVDPDRLLRPWSSSGATVRLHDGRLEALSTTAALARAAGRALERGEADALVGSLRAAVAASRRPTKPLPLPGGRVLALDRRPALLGVVNVTPDSFSDGGRLYPTGHPDAAVAYARTLLQEGADVIDVGGESTRPGADPTAVREERGRVLPVVERLAADGVVVSIDTRKPGLARDALRAGACIVNDVSAARNPAMLETAGELGAAYVVMHSRGDPRDMQQHTDYHDVVAEVYEFLAEGVRRCAVAGIPPDRVVLDPGIGFAKSAEQNLDLLRALAQFRGLGHPVLVGASRKRFLARLSAGAGGGECGPDERTEASLATVALAVGAGAALLRVHDVRASRRAARTARAVVTGEQDWPDIVRAA